MPTSKFLSVNPFHVLHIVRSGTYDPKHKDIDIIVILYYNLRVMNRVHDRSDFHPDHSTYVKRRIAVVTAAAGLAAFSAAAVPKIIDTHNGIECDPSAEYTVQPGDTLWGIASKIAVDGASTLDVQQKILSDNPGLSANLMPGETFNAPPSCNP